MRAIEADFRRRIPAVERTAAIENLRHVLRKHARELRPESSGRRIAERVGAAIAVLIGDDEVEVFAVAIRAVADQAVDRGQVVWLVAKAVLVPLSDCDIRHRGRIEAFERGSADLLATRWQIFPPCLVGGDLDALAGPRLAGLLDALPALPREFVVVPDRDERPARASVLEVGIGEIAFVDGPVAIDGQRYVELADLVAIREARNLIDRAVVAGLHLVGILDDLVDEIAKMENEVELLAGGSALIFVDHP